MASDDHPIEALRQQFKLEDVSSTPFSGIVVKALQSLPKALPYPFDKLIDLLKEGLSTDAAHRIQTMVEVCSEEIIRQDGEIRNLVLRLDEQQKKQRTEATSELLLDASRRAAITRSLERVKRIGVILANGVTPEKIDGDETEEMMRIAMELSDQDVFYLSELVKLEGLKLRSTKRIERYDAHTTWERGPWGTIPNADIDSVFSKLESYGLVSRLAPPNNLNIMADFQNRYVLLQKGMRFVDAISKRELNPH